jgi:hypothetical protein
VGSQDLAAERTRLQQRLDEAAATTSTTQERLAAEVAAARQAQEATAAALEARAEALARGEAALRSAQLEVQLSSRAASHEEELTREKLAAQRAALVSTRKRQAGEAQGEGNKVTGLVPHPAGVWACMINGAHQTCLLLPNTLGPFIMLCHTSLPIAVPHHPPPPTHTHTAFPFVLPSRMRSVRSCRQLLLT